MHELFGAVHVRSVNSVRLNRQVLIDELSAIEVVGDDATNLCCSQEHVVRFVLGKKVEHLRLVDKIKFIMSFRDDVGVTLFDQLSMEARANEAPVTSNIDGRIFVKFNSQSLSPLSFMSFSC